MPPRPYSRREALRVGAAVAAGIGLGPLIAGCDRKDSSAPKVTTPYLWGLHVDEERLFSNLRAAERQVNRRADVVLIFRSVSRPPTDILTRLQNSGYQVALTLEFWDGIGGDWRPWSLPSIARGDHDAALESWLTAMAKLPTAIHLRPLHEFNGNWYPWGVYSSGNSVESFHAAWRRIARAARRIAGDKVRLQLCFNRQNGWDGFRELPGTARDFYPGDDVVDELVINGYNRPTKTTSKSFAEIFHRYYSELRTLRPDLPLWVGETASSEKFGDKPEWIEDMFRQVLTRYPVACLTWFNETLTIPGEPQRDWKFDSTPESLAAMRDGLTWTTAPTDTTS
jgi:Glycosyl hydrolase family 26